MPLGYRPALQISTRSSKMASDTAPPAMLAAYYFSPSSQFSRTYTFNPFQDIGNPDQP
ncbi:hypothetical protein HNS30_33875 [Corallococcus exercitus]|uniref:Uncharacterized protein n=1 Tax=Corallococcus exercitus TaxID=2316736 RepID=A0A7Y4JZG7_9BACT|nr:hypothetical protein [Corallococcus exercitus]